MQIGNTLGKMTSSRSGGVLLGIGVAVLAAILLAVYVTRYRDSVNRGAATVSVLQARNLIPKGTAGTQIAKTAQYQIATVAKDELKTGAISDPALLAGRVTIADIYPGQQLTLGDFSEGATAALNTQIIGPQRAVTLTIDATRGSLANVVSGDRIDIYQQLSGPKGTIVKLFRPNVLVMQAPGAGGGNVVLEVASKDVPDFLFAWSNTTLAFVVRPATRATPTVPSVADFKSMLTFSKPH
jgi:Flp pilus assembly protein CpaB